MGVCCLLELDLSASDAVHGVLFTLLQLAHFIKMQVFHLSAERLHLVAVLGCLIDADARNFELLETFYLSLQIVLIASFALLLVLEHALLERFEGSSPLHVFGLEEVLVDATKLFIEAQHVTAHVLCLALNRRTAWRQRFLCINAVDHVGDERSAICLVQNVLVSLEAEHIDHLLLRPLLARLPKTESSLILVNLRQHYLPS